MQEMVGNRKRKNPKVNSKLKIRKLENYKNDLHCGWLFLTVLFNWQNLAMASWVSSYVQTCEVCNYKLPKSLWISLSLKTDPQLGICFSLWDSGLKMYISQPLSSVESPLSSGSLGQMLACPGAQGLCLNSLSFGSGSLLATLNSA